MTFKSGVTVKSQSLKQSTTELRSLSEMDFSELGGLTVACRGCGLPIERDEQATSVMVIVWVVVEWVCGVVELVSGESLVRATPPDRVGA